MLVSFAGALHCIEGPKLIFSIWRKQFGTLKYWIDLPEGNHVNCIMHLRWCGYIMYLYLSSLGRLTVDLEIIPKYRELESNRMIYVILHVTKSNI